MATGGVRRLTCRPPGGRRLMGRDPEAGFGYEAEQHMGWVGRRRGLQSGRDKQKRREQGYVNEE